jgi:predicted ATPase/Tfp pilus assembly protein PilF
VRRSAADGTTHHSPFTVEHEYEVRVPRPSGCAGHMAESQLAVQDHCVAFARARDSLRVLLAQISPAYDRDVFAKQFVARVKDPDRQAERIVRIIEHAASAGTDLLLFPELVAPFSYLQSIEDALAGIGRDFVACIPYEHTSLQEFRPLLRDEEIEQHGLGSTAGEGRLVNFSRIFIRAGDETRLFTQIKLTPFSGEFSLSARDTLVCGDVLHRFVTNWGAFVFLICKDYVGEVRTQPRVPMFDFLKSLTEEDLHYVFVSALNPEPEAFVHAARSFYYLQEKSAHTYTLFLNGAELDHTAIVFPARPHPGARTGEHVAVLPLFETKPGWGTQVRFPGYAEKLISATLTRLDTYTSIATKEVYSPVHRAEVSDLAELGIPSEEIAQPGDREKAPPARIPQNLPSQPTPFIGRTRELAHLNDLLDKPSCRLITLVGPGGVGKTRLSLAAAAARIDSFPHGAYFVPLAALSSPDFLVSAIADSLRFSFYGRGDPRAQLLDYLREKQMLLLLDNFEHLLEGAMLVGDIVRHAPEVRLLVTSRERLNLTGEWAVEVEGLPVPEAVEGDDLEQYDAVQLFMQSARRARSDFTLSEDQRPSMVRICQLVEGMPLAIELAASWVRALSCGEILEEIEPGIGFLASSMRDVSERHRSVRAVFDHSWELLSEEERTVLARLSVFRGGFRRDAARQVAEALLPVLSVLVGKSVLRRDPSGRYEMHELLRQYAEEKLRDTPGQPEGVRNLHSNYYAGFVHEREEILRTEADREALHTIAGEIENIRAGWSCAVENGTSERIIQYSAGLYLFYEATSRFREGEEAFGAAIEELRSLQPREPGQAKQRVGALGEVLTRQGAFLYRLGQYAESRKVLEESLSIARELDDRHGMARSLRSLGSVDYALGEYAAARKLLEESLEASTEIGDQRGIATSLSHLGHVLDHVGEHQEAEQLYRRSLAICKDIDDRRGVAACLNNLGGVAYGRGCYTEVKKLLEETLPMHRELGNRYGVATCLNNMGLVTWAMGESEEAKMLYLQSLEIHREIGDRNGLVGCLNNLGNTAWALGEYEEARDYHEQALRIREEVGERRGIATSLNNLGLVEQASGRYASARELHRRSLAIREEIGDRPGVATSHRHLGVVAYELGEYEEARRLLQASLAICESLEDQEGRANSLNGLGDTARALGNFAEAGHHLRAALRTATGICAIPVALDSLVGFAALLVDQGRTDDAVRLLILVTSHRMAYQPTRDRARVLLTELAAKTPGAAALAAEHHAEALDFDATAAELLRETSD